MRRAAANPKGFLAGEEAIQQERVQAFESELERLTTTPEGGGELLFDLSTLFVGGEGVEAGLTRLDEASALASRARTSELGNALANLGKNPLGKNLNTLDEFGAGAGFSGVYDEDSGKFLAYPSGGTKLLSGKRPLNLVTRSKGHLQVNEALSTLLGTASKKRLGFFFKVDNDGALEVSYKSGSVNRANPAVRTDLVPEHRQQTILDAITKETKKKAYTKPKPAPKLKP